jgi:opacity protein-like surface antigen
MKGLGGQVRYMTVLLLVVLAALAAIPAASAAANHQVVGRGSTTQFLCANGVLSTATIDFNAQKSKGIVQGNFSIFGPAVQKFGGLNDGTINESSYSLQGFITFEQCGSTIFQNVGTATVYGECGTAVVIHYQDTLGQRGDFIGNVACS